jgi:hypothetical protein
MDLAGLALIVGVAIALWRRLVTRPEYLPLKGSTLLILFGLLFMGLSGFGLEAYRIAAQPNEWAPAAFIGWSLSRLLTGVAEPTGTPTVVYAVFWWLHAGAAFALIVGAAWSGFSHLWVLPASVVAHDPARPRTELTTPFNLAAAMESEEDIELVSGTAAQIAYKNGINPIHFWMMALVAFEVGYLSPPVALNQLLSRQAVGEKEVAKGALEGTSFWYRHEKTFLPLATMGTTLLLVSIVPILVNLYFN